MDDDSRITRLREYIQLQLRRDMKENMHERYGIQFFLKKIIAELGARSNGSEAKKRFSKNSKINSNYIRDKESYRKIEEEIGKSYKSIDNNPIQGEKVFDDLKIEIYPIGSGHMASITDLDGNKFSKVFADEETADIWVRNKSLELTQKFTQ